MKKQIAILISTASLASVSLVSTSLMSAASQKFNGTITDDMCAKADHKDMKMASDEKCVSECVKGMKGKYVLYDGKDSWVLSDQKSPAKFAAKKVTVTGSLDEKTKTIKVDKIEAAK